MSIILTLTGFDNRSTFSILKSVVYPNNHCLFQKGGRPSLLSDEVKLGIFLFYVGSRMQVKYLCLLFGVTPSSCCAILEQVRKRIVKSLKNHYAAKIQFPNEEKKVQLAAMVKAREPRIKNVIVYLDGLSIAVQCTEDRESQSLHYSGFHADTRCQNLFLFSPEGKIVYCVINNPGSWHDAAVAFPLVRFILSCIGTFVICVDSGFLYYIGLNQIATVFNPEYEQYINVEGYDKLKKFYSF